MDIRKKIYITLKKIFWLNCRGIRMKQLSDNKAYENYYQFMGSTKYRKNLLKNQQSVLTKPFFHIVSDNYKQILQFDPCHDEPYQKLKLFALYILNKLPV